MGGMLVDSKNECCCPEMRCCAPETVTVVVSGMAGQILHTNAGEEPWTDSLFRKIQGLDPTFLNSSYRGIHSLNDILVLNGYPTGQQNPYRENGNQDLLESLGPYLVPKESVYRADANPWPPAEFPPVVAQLSEGPGSPICSTIGWYPNAPVLDTADIPVVRYETYADICDPDKGGNPLFCSRPPEGSRQGGSAVNVGYGNRLEMQSDLNGTYVCHRPDIPLRPQLQCRINRQVPLSTQSPYKGVTEAILLYNVDPKREWVYYIPPGLQEPCWDVLFPPGGDDYVVDYRCGQRNPWYSTFGFGYCTRGKCTVTNQGVGKPHLYYYNTKLDGATSPADVVQMQSADLYLRLIPKDYENDPNGRLPTWWQVGGVDIRGGGYGYKVGDFFQVDFDIRRPWLGGEIMTLFPYTESLCLLPTYLNWTDKYGYSGTLKNTPSGTGFELFQRLRVSSVDENGAITAIEVVPIYKSPEFSDYPLCFVEKVSNPRPKYYVGYGRVLCHPRSVQMPGIGYTVGDTIEWYCDDPPCTVHRQASAVVIDVDEEGGIIDWLIKGSDAFRYVSQNFCVFPFTATPGGYCTSCLSYPWGGEGFEDERGSYSWSAKSLCSLNWSGIGVPVRSARTPNRLFAGAEPTKSCSGSANESALTNVSLTITRRTCETSIEVIVAQWPFDQMAQSTHPPSRIVAMFPSYPKCNGGGAVVRPIFGGWGGNESDFGGPLVGADIEAAGAEYCYREKYHVEPTLPNDVPSIGGGSGARIASFTFRSVHNFPSPEAPYGDSPPAYNRFSYFPVTGAQVDTQQRGSGYSVGQTFDVSPVGGRAVTDVWRRSGGDTPDACPNGAWYGSGQNTLLCGGDYMCMSYHTETGVCGEATCTRPSICTLRIAEVNEAGGIVSLEVVNGGMMFKTEWGVGKKNPAVFVLLQSTLGYGAYITATFGETYGSSDFGMLTSVAVVAPPPGTLDPKHPALPATSWRAAQPAANMPTGGRDYADESAGYFWMLENVTVGGPVLKDQWSLLAHMGWTGRDLNGGIAEPESPKNQAHELWSTHNLVEGSVPFAPRSSVCAFSDCYHSLLNRTYPLVKVWSAGQGWFAPGFGFVDTSGPPFTSGDSSPATGYGLLVDKTAVFTPIYIRDPNNPMEFIPSGSSQTTTGKYIVVEHGPQITVSHALPSCPDHSNGATTDGAAA